MKAFVLIFAFGLAGGATLRAQPMPGSGEVRFEQRVGAKLPLDRVVVDLTGRPHALRDYFRGRPVVLYFGYASCPQLCSIVADGTAAALREIRPAVGRDVDVITLSLDPAETASAGRARLDEAVHRYGDPLASASWHYLRGGDEAIRALTAAAGFHYQYDPRSRQYAHASGFVVVTPQGVVSRYFLGVDFEARLVARAIARAAEGRTGEPVYEVLVRCFQDGGPGGAYGRVIWAALACGVVATVCGLFGWVGWALREERRRALREAKP